MKLLLTICTVLTLAAAPCLAQETPTNAPAANAPAPAAVSAPAPGINTATAANSNSYQLGPGDRMRVTVFGETELSGEYDVADDGTVSFPLVGQVPASGLTPEQFSQALTQRLRGGYLREPRIASSVISYRPFYILGEVTRPGTYPYAANLDVMSAVAIAGGFTYRANRGRAYIRRAGEERETAYRLNETVRLRPGDTIRIGERFF